MAEMCVDQVSMEMEQDLTKHYNLLCHEEHIHGNFGVIGPYFLTLKSGLDVYYLLQTCLYALSTTSYINSAKIKSCIR